jgi:T5orf172 domain-containing protein
VSDHTLYAISDGANHCKIGITSRPLNIRLSSLQSGNPRRLKVVRTMSFVTRKAALRVEKEFLAGARRHSAFGEWIETSPGAVERWFDASIGRWHREWKEQS